MTPKISSAEWEVMNAVWERNPITAAQVFASLPQGHGWAPKTVNTFLTRLVDKGVLAVAREGKAFLYTPRIARETCVRAESETFLKRVFQGAAGPLVLHFAEHGQLTEEEVRELEQWLNARKGRQ